MKGLAFLAFISTLVVSSSRSATSELKCKPELDDLDYHLKNAFLMNPLMALPKSTSAHKEWCKPYLTISKRIAQYGNQCEKAFPAQIVKIYANAVKKPIKFVCIKKKEETLRNFVCMNDGYKKRLQNIIDPLLYNLEYTAKNVAGDDLIPMFCCNFVIAIDILQTKLEPPKCESPQTNPSKFAARIIDSLIGDIFDLICPTYYGHMNACEEKIPEAMKQMRNPNLKGFNITKVPVIHNILKVVGKIARD